MTRTSLLGHRRVSNNSGEEVWAVLLVVLSCLIFSSVKNQDAFATQKSQPHKKSNCVNSSKAFGHRAPCAIELRATIKKVSTTRVSIQTKSPIATSNEYARLLKTDSITCKLPSQNTRGDVEIGFPRIANRIPSIGNIQAVMVFVDFRDAPASIATKTLYSYFDSAPALLQTLSYDKANLHISTDLQWHRMSRTSTSYSQNLKRNFTGLRSFMSEAIALAATTEDLSKANVIYVVSNPAAKSITGSMAFLALPGYEINTGNTSISNGAFLGSNSPSAYAATLVHETSHTFGLVDDWNVNFNSSVPNDAFRFTGDFSIMGTLYGAAPEYFAWEEWLMGWLDDSQVDCLAPGNHILTLQALETSGGLKMAVIPISATKAVLIESRRSLLADVGLHRSGVLIYTVDTSIASANGPLRIVGGTTDLHFTDALLTKGGQSIIGNIKVNVTDSTQVSDTIRVSVG